MVSSVAQALSTSRDKDRTTAPWNREYIIEGSSLIKSDGRTVAQSSSSWKHLWSRVTAVFPGP
ncbi:MAG: hypothetical protein LZF60_10060 [Nitrospira sp.]|nr:MAG: hypothetical protein LZF60_10060 [Nitrospira sp.]